MQQILNIIMNRAQLGETDDIETDKRWINYIANMDRINWGIRKPVFHDGTNMIAQNTMIILVCLKYLQELLECRAHII